MLSQNVFIFSAKLCLSRVSYGFCTNSSVKFKTIVSAKLLLTQLR